MKTQTQTKRRKIICRPVGYYEDLRRQLTEQGPTHIPYADTTSLNLKGVWKRWDLYCNTEATTDPVDFIKSATVADYKTFFTWLLDSYPTVKKKSSLHQYWRQLKMLYKEHAKRLLHRDLVDDVNKHIQVLTKEYRLDQLPPKRPVLDVDGLLVLLFHNMVHCAQVYKEEEQRLLVDLLLLFGAYTGARPVSLVDASVRDRDKEAIEEVRDNAIQFYDSSDEDESNQEGEMCESGLQASYNVPEVERLKSILYEHVTIVAVRVQSRVQLAMFLTLIHTKGEDRKPQPKTFKMYQNKNPLLCPIARIVAIGLHHNAFAASSIRSPEAILRARIPSRKNCRIFKWKESMLRQPLFREPARNNRATNTVEPLRAQTAARYLKRLGRDAGLEQPLTQSCIRRGAGNAVDNAGTVGERDQVMGHSYSEIFQFYINPNVKCDVQAAFLDEPSDSALMKLLGNMSLTRDPLAPTRLGPDDARAIETHPSIARLRLRRDEMTKRLRELRHEPKDRVGEIEELAALRKNAEKALRQKKKQLRDRRMKKIRERYFKENDTKELEEEGDLLLEGEAEVEPEHVYALEERANIANLLRKAPVDLSKPEALDQRIELVQNLKDLCGRREVRRRGAASNPSALDPRDQDKNVAFSLPIVCKARQCLFCIGDEALSLSQRTFCWSRPAKMMDHVEQVHLNLVGVETEIICPHPSCRERKVTLNGVLHFKAHALQVHKIKLRVPK